MNAWKRFAILVALSLSVVVGAWAIHLGTIRDCCSERSPLETYWEFLIRSRRSSHSRVLPEVNNLKEILTALTLYSGDKGGYYPKGQSANEAFRELFASGNCDNERKFWSPYAPESCHPAREPDELIGLVGENPFGQALEPGENAWAYVSGLDDGRPPGTPMVARVLDFPPGCRRLLLGTLDGAASIVRLKDSQTMESIIAPMIADIPGAKLLRPLPR